MDTAPGTAVVLVNLGTPEAPTAPALKRYLRQFLSDPRVVEIPRALWWLILNGIILNIRPKKSAAKYAVGLDGRGLAAQGSYRTPDQVPRRHLGERGHHLTVTWAMRYGAPSLPAVLDRLKAAGVTRILLLPMYPQYSASTTATVIDEACRWLLTQRNQPEMRFVRNFHDDPGYIEALAQTVRKHWMKHGRLGCRRSTDHQLPRPAAAQSRSRRPLLLRMHENRPPAGRAPESRPNSTGSASSHVSARRSGCNPTPRQPSRRWPRRDGTGRRDLPRLRRRLPGNPRRNRHGRQGLVHGSMAARNTTTFRHSTKTRAG
jgi:hypothetical protein